ncbi:MAG TPA: hypothetical protein VE977_09705, partial [Pyrinomonadaceae bacterium]|nr:hypothetical protein [Pyrinomonadaceae bacterium]
IVVWHHLHPLRQNLLLLPNLLRRQLRRQNPRHLGPRQDRCRLLARQRLVVEAAGAERSRSRRLLLLQGTDLPGCLLAFASIVFSAHTAGGAVVTNQAARIACEK